MEIQKINLNNIKLTYPATKKHGTGNAALPTVTPPASIRAGQRRLREETVVMNLNLKSVEIAETSTVKKINVHIDEGWDDEINILLDNGICLEFKWFADPGFVQGQQVKLTFNEDRSQLKVQVGEKKLSFFRLNDNLYIPH